MMRRRSRTAPTSDVLLGATNAIAMRTSASFNEGLGLRVNPDWLDEQEQTEFVHLVREAGGEYGAWSFDHLDDRNRKRLEALIEKGAGPSAFGIFKRTRERERATAEIRAMAREAARPAQPSVGEQERLVRVMFELVKGGALHLDRLAVGIFLVGSLLAADTISPGARFEGGGDELTLVLRPHLGLGANLDPYGQLSRWRDAIAQLDRNGLLEAEQQGDELRVRLGWRTLRALGRPTSAAA